MTYLLRVILAAIALGTAGFPTLAQYAPNGIQRTPYDVGPREDGSGAFRTHCVESHDSHDDPLVWPGRPGATHRHVFFGNPNVDHDTTIETLARATATTCDGGTLNRSAYWVPALYDQQGERIRYIDPLFYYKTGYHVPAASIRPPPQGLRMIAGNAHATSPQGVHVAKFRCSGWRSNQVWFDRTDPLDHVNYLPDCDVGDQLEIRLVFPQCWDGIHLSAPDNQSHMAYPRPATPPHVGTGACPRSHPIAIPEISYNFSIYVSEHLGASSAWRFSSDMGEAIPGSSIHADWMNGWDPDIMEKVVLNCLNTGFDCVVGLLGDGTRLRPVELD